MAKILIVDDEREVLFVIKKLLNESGYKTAEAMNGLGALEAFQREFFDLIITDLRMPTMNGLSFLGEVRKLEPSIPVIILTAYGSDETAAESMESGAFRYMAKPFKADELLNTVKSAINTSKINKLFSTVTSLGINSAERGSPDQNDGEVNRLGGGGTQIYRATYRARDSF